MFPVIWLRSAVKSPNIDPNITSFLCEAYSVRYGAAGVLGPLTRLSNATGTTKFNKMKLKLV